MKKSLIALSLAALASVAAAQPATPDAAAHDHAHGAGGTAAPSGAPSRAAPTDRARSRPATGMAGRSMMGSSNGATQEALAKLDTQISALRAMHARLQAAPSAEARRALLAEQMQLVQQSLALAAAAPMPSMSMMPGTTMGGMAGAGPMAGRETGSAQRPSGQAPGSASQPTPGGAMHEPMHDGMRMRSGMAGMMAMHQVMAKRMELLHVTVQALADRAVATETPR